MLIVKLGGWVGGSQRPKEKTQAKISKKMKASRRHEVRVKQRGIFLRLFF